MVDNTHLDTLARPFTFAPLQSPPHQHLYARCHTPRGHSVSQSSTSRKCQFYRPLPGSTVWSSGSREERKSQCINTTIQIWCSVPIRSVALHVHMQSRSHTKAQLHAMPMRLMPRSHVPWHSTTSNNHRHTDDNFVFRQTHGTLANLSYVSVFLTD